MRLQSRLQDFPAGRQLPRLHQLEAERTELEAALKEAQSRVSTLDRLNVFSDSPAELRVKEIQLELNRNGEERARVAAEWNQALTSLAEEFPEFALARRFEGVLEATLAYLQGQAKVPLTQVRELIQLLQQNYCNGQTLGSLLMELREAHGEGRPPSLDLSPRNAEELCSLLPTDVQGWNLESLGTLCKLTEALAQVWGPARLLLALAQLEALLKRSTATSEGQLTGAGEIVKSPLVVGGFWIVDSLESLLVAFRQVLPGVPLGQDLQNQFLRGLPMTPGTADRIQGLPSSALTLAALDHLLEEAARRVHWVDRVNVFHNSESELWEKQLKAALAEAEEGLKPCRPESPGECGLVTELLLEVARCAERVSTRKGESSSKINCPLYHHGDLCEAVAQLRSFLSQGRPLAPTLKLLVDDLTEGGSELALHLRARIEREPFLQLLGEARQLRRDTLERLRLWKELRHQVGVLDRLNIFSESDSERAEKEAKSAWRQSDAQAEAKELDLERLLMTALAQFPLVHLYYLSEELSLQVPMMSAQCTSRTHTYYRDGRQRTRRYYSCYVSGLTSVKAEIRDLLALAYSCGCRGSRQHDWLHQRAQQVSDSALLSQLPERWRSGGGALTAGEVRVRSRREQVEDGWAREMYLEWCLANQTGPAAPGRF